MQSLDPQGEGSFDIFAAIVNKQHLVRRDTRKVERLVVDYWIGLARANDKGIVTRSKQAHPLERLLKIPGVPWVGV